MPYDPPPFTATKTGYEKVITFVSCHEKEIRKYFPYLIYSNKTIFFKLLYNTILSYVDKIVGLKLFKYWPFKSIVSIIIKIRV